MVPRIARHLICPAHEWLLGRKTFRYARELEESQWASPNELRQLQEIKLRALLRHARANTPFYRRRLMHPGANVTSSDVFEVLAQLPLLEKSDVRRSGRDMVWADTPGGVLEYNTGGSDGSPLTFYFDRRRQAYDQAARIRSHRWFGIDVGDREVYLWGSPIELRRTDLLKRVRDALFNQRLLNAFDMSSTRMDSYLDVLDRFQPACLFGYPSSVALLVEHARSRGRTIDTRSLRAILVTGEVCYPHYRQAITSFADVPVANEYGSREGGFIAHECPQGNTHLIAENVIVEIIKDGRAVPPGGAGEIVLTHLDAYAMPFIRYRTGDVGRLKAGRCRCGRGLPMMDVVQGRTTDFLYLPDGSTKHALSIIYPLRAMRGVRQFRVTQQEDYSVTIDVVCDERTARVTRDVVERGVRPVLGDNVQVRVALVERIPTGRSGKHRYVVSHARPARRQSQGEAVAGV